MRALPVCGGSPMSQQIRRMKTGVHVVVGTPGRIMDHLRRGYADPSLVPLDEMLRRIAIPTDRTAHEGRSWPPPDVLDTGDPPL